MKIYIVRHGETNANKEGRFQGWVDEPLNEFGEELARETGEGLKGVHFDVAFSSPLVRAKKTAEHILKESGNNCPVFLDERIKEMGMGEMEGCILKKEATDEFSRKMQQYIAAPLKFGAFPGGESAQDVIKRTQNFLFELAKKDYGTVLVSTHGGALRCMLNCLYDDPSDFWHGHVPYNCVVNIVEVNDGNLKLVGDDLIFYDKAKCFNRFEPQ